MRQRKGGADTRSNRVTPCLRQATDLGFAVGGGEHCSAISWRRARTVRAGVLHPSPLGDVVSFDAVDHAHELLGYVLRVVRYLEDARTGFGPPILPWRLPPCWCATFDYEGSLDAMAGAFEWILSAWVPHTGVRRAFLPTMSSLKELGQDVVRAKLRVPIRRLQSMASLPG